MRYDLMQIVLVNESRAEERAGDVSLFNGMKMAASSLEAVDVRNNEYRAYCLDGSRLKLTEDGLHVSIELANGERNEQLIRSLLEQAAAFVIAAHSKRGSRHKFHSFDLLKLSIDELVDIVGVKK